MTVDRLEVDGFEALTIAGESGDLVAAFVPAAGMVGCSLTHRGAELLGQRHGLRAYAEQRTTMGIPLLYPWANRLGSRRFPLRGRTVDLESSSLPLKEDEAGLPIHGLLSGATGWQVERHEPSGGGALLEASFDFAAREDLLRAFPFPHQLRITAQVSGSRLTITTAVRATGETAVPISFGYHPYFRLPEVERSAWEVAIPVGERLLLDAQKLPTGERQPADVAAGPLGDRSFDDGFTAPPAGKSLALAGAGRRIEVRFESGYPFAQVYAPAGEELIAFEPMTAPTNALLEAGPELPVAAPGREFEAAFSIEVIDLGAAS